MSVDQGITTWLATEDLEALKKGFDHAGMIAATNGFLDFLNPVGAPYIDNMVNLLYTGDPVSHDDREKILIAILAMRGDPLTLAVHLYWGMMEGLTLAQVGMTLLIVSGYAGVPAYTQSLLTLKTTCQTLKGCIAAGKVSSGDVKNALIATFMPQLLPKA